MTNDKLSWLEISVADLTSDNQKLYASLKKAQEQTAKIRSDFEAAVRTQAASMVPEGNDLAFSYRFGKISVALVPQEKPKASAKNTFKLGK
jgi:hypothetical protein